MDRYVMVAKIMNSLAHYYEGQVNSLVSYGSEDDRTRLRKIIDLTEEYNHVFNCLVATVPLVPGEEDKKKCCCKD